MFFSVVIQPNHHLIGEQRACEGSVTRLLHRVVNAAPAKSKLLVDFSNKPDPFPTWDVFEIYGNRVLRRIGFA